MVRELLRHWRDRLRHRWVTFDEVYGRDPDFVSGLEELAERYIGEVPKDTRVWLRHGAWREDAFPPRSTSSVDSAPGSESYGARVPLRSSMNASTLRSAVVASVRARQPPAATALA